MSELRDLIERSFKRAAEYRKQFGWPEPSDNTLLGFPVEGNSSKPDGVAHARSDGKLQLTPIEETN